MDGNHRKGSSRRPFSTDSDYRLIQYATCQIDFLTRQFGVESVDYIRSFRGRKTDRWQQVLSTIRGTKTAQQDRDLQVISVDPASSKSPCRLFCHKEQVIGHMLIAGRKTRI